MRPLDPRITTYARRARALWHGTTPTQRADGETWYYRARTACEHLAFKYDRPIDTVIGVVAALSPSCAWERNLHDAETVLMGKRGRGRRRPATYGKNIRKAHRMLSMTTVAELEAALCPRESTNKTLTFFRLIREPYRRDLACVDSHIARALMRLEGYSVEVWPALQLRLQRALAIAAKGSGFTLPQFNATLWIRERDARKGAEQ